MRKPATRKCGWKPCRERIRVVIGHKNPRVYCSKKCITKGWNARNPEKRREIDRESKRRAHAAEMARATLTPDQRMASDRILADLGKQGRDLREVPWGVTYHINRPSLGA